MGFFNGGRTGATAPQDPMVIDELTAYWETLRDGGDVPPRSNVDPRAIQKVLKNAFILERIAPGIARLRVSCNTLTDLMGMDMRGMPITSLITRESHEGFGHILEDVFSGPAIGKLELSSGGGFRKSGLKAEMLLLPLKSDKGEVNRILGAITCNGPISKEPQRFELDGSLVRQIGIPAKVKTTDRAPTRPNRAPVQLLGTNSDMNDPDLVVPTELLAMTKPTRHSHLRLVVTDA